jgi:hypothetical protein
MLGMETEVTKSKDASGAVRRANKRRLEDSADKGFAVSQDRAPVDRGTLLQSGFQPRWVDGRLIWGYRARHAAPIEFGTEPFWPPIDPLLEWAERVAGDRGLGYYVQWKIAQEGVDPQPYVRPGRDAQRRFLDSHDFENYLDDELRR